MRSIHSLPWLFGLVVSLGPIAFSADPSSRETGLRYGDRQLPSLSRVELAGDLRDRFDAATRNLLSRVDGRYGPETFRASARGEPGALWWDWPGDQVGRWLSVLHVAGAHDWPGVAENRRMVLEASLPHLNEDGRFGPRGTLDSRDARIPSGNAFALRGLVDALEDGIRAGNVDGRCPVAVGRLRDSFAATFPAWSQASGGRLHEFWGHSLDGLVRFHELTGDEAALDLASRIAQTAGRTSHTHHSLSLYRGVVELYRITGDRGLLGKARDYLEWCREHRIATGGLPEAMPSSPQDEGCALADAVILDLMMFAATGEDAFLEDAEHLLVNHFAFNQFSTGGFGHRAFDRELIGAKGWQGWDGKFGSENPGCCSLWGQWALGQVGQYAITRSAGVYEVNLLAEVSAEFPEDGVRIALSGDYPRMRSTRLRVATATRRHLVLRIRVPSWAEGVALAVNGGPIEARHEGSRLVVDREWGPGDVLEIEVASGIRLLRSTEGAASRGVVCDGPLVLGLSSASADVARAWSLVLDGSGRPRRDADGLFLLRDGKEEHRLPLRAIAEDRRSSDVREPNRVRVAFAIEAAPSSPEAATPQ